MSKGQTHNITKYDNLRRNRLGVTHRPPNSPSPPLRNQPELASMPRMQTSLQYDPYTERIRDAKDTKTFEITLGEVILLRNIVIY